MSLFDAIGIAGTGVTVNRKWMDAVSDNLANINTVKRTDEDAFAARYVVATEAGDGKGTQVAGIVTGSPEGRMVHEPDHPLADENGYVKYPDIDMSTQMTSLMMAQRAYQANLQTITSAKDAYQAALQLGKG
ncbi:flagellar basal body rod protein FlgC [Paenibacillus sp. TRM 82003]|uniref:flagellar basal body rod protein FlgC n=1 Tax=Kineococcus sp. TRM81007 TaxID=2925831 RepID=UPI001F578B07|nr:flagellar basal body rod protein FlgC [Kineococcus sp. TRM81007]MCI2240614.1 flagellar basal body rod protein FlgC [Kineococcus sp. TRM81007]MCI3925464.1 flagellar basal body rod protein FlgC [Paenibacillus sp. TRM 82003]